MKRLFTQCLLAFPLSLMLLLPLFAQSKLSLRGQVVDDVDAVIPGAKVTMTSASGQQRTVMTEGDGSFTIPELLPGAYQLSVTFDGFKPHVDNALQITATQAPLKVVLKVAEVSIETTVSAEDPADTTDPEKNMNAIVLDEKFIEPCPTTKRICALI